MRKKIISARKFIKPSFSYLVEKKRDGGEFSDEEIRFIVDSILDEEMPKFQQKLLSLWQSIFVKTCLPKRRQPLLKR